MPVYVELSGRQCYEQNRCRYTLQRHPPGSLARLAGSAHERYSENKWRSQFGADFGFNMEGLFFQFHEEREREADGKSGRCARQTAFKPLWAGGNRGKTRRIDEAELLAALISFQVRGEFRFLFLFQKVGVFLPKLLRFAGNGRQFLVPRRRFIQAPLVIRDLGIE